MPLRVIGAMGPLDTSIVVVLLLPVVLLPAAAIVSASAHPPESWEAIGRSRDTWLVAFWLFPIVVGVVAAIAYFVRVRPHLPDLHRQAFEPGTAVVVRSGPDAGKKAIVLGRSLIFRPSGALTIQILGTGERVRYPPMALRHADSDPT